ncbi:uncharacterized protein ppp1r3ab [Girardinichthys multiradiatus]|uniref:uncharacterized protein ppp1r3ab n=1 Tax=Girardinichthys multiradiatus TaxID=208333 RepID=UPI001FAD3C8B|nr:uncharacterized protein ppp1r3ab [Girardinichthys multiradiatus]
MEFAGQLRPSEACNYLAVPGFSGLDPDEDEGDLIIGFRPKFSPIPSRRSSISDEDSDPDPPFCGSRRVSFADAKGLSLVQVKEFDTWDVPKLPGYDSAEVEGKDSVEYHLSPLTFSLPLSSTEVMAKVLNQKVELETIELLPGTTILKGVIRVLNISYNKSVYIRTSLDKWATHFDLLAEYVPGSSNGVMDSFSFKLTLVPPFGDQGVMVDFCLRYETPAGTYWANNNNRNYVLSCQHRMKEGSGKPQTENANKKSCLKTYSQSVSTVENISSKQASSQENMSTDESVRAPEEGEAKKISQGQSATSYGEGQKLSMENKQNSSRRRQRQAARMARLRDYYAQSEGGEKDMGKDKKPPEIKQTTCEETPGHNVVGQPPFNEGNIKSECPQFVFDTLEACSKPLHNAAHAHTSTEQMKSELVVLARGESASDISNNPPHSAGEAAPPEQQNIRELVTTNTKGDMSLACTNNPATASNEILISQADSFTFSTVVAPLYRQAFQRPSAENPVNMGDFNHPSEIRLTCCVVPINTRNGMGKVQGNHTEEKETVNKIPKCEDIAQNPIKKEKNPDQSGTNISLGQQQLLGRNFPFESIHSQTKAQEEIQSSGAAKPPQCQSPEHNYSLISANVDETLAKDKTKQGFKPFRIRLGHFAAGTNQLVTGVQEKDYECSEVDKENESRKSVTTSTEDKLLQVFNELNSNQTDSKGCLNSTVYLCEPERKDLASLNESLEAQEEANIDKDVFGLEKGNKSNSNDIKVMYEVAQSIINEVRSNNHCHADMSGRSDGLNVLEKKGHCEMDSSFINQDEDFLLMDIVEGKNWEMMVEEEENSVLSKEKQIGLLNSKTEANETDGKAEEATGIKIERAVVEESQVCIGKEFKPVNIIKTDGIESTELNKMDGQKVTELQNETKIHWVSTEKAGVQEDEEKTEIDMKQDNLAQLNKENGEQKNTDFKQIILVSEAGEIVITDADSDMAMQNREDEAWSFKVGSDFTQSKVEDDLSALVSRAAKNDSSERQYVYSQTDTRPTYKDGVQSNKGATDDQSKADTKNPTSKGGMCDSADEPDSNSAESDSDEELQLYVHCLRAAGAPAQVHKDKIRDAGFTASKRPSINRGKLPPTPMPSISEALNEEQQHSSPPETHKDIKTPTEPTSDKQETINQNEWRWKDLFCCKTLLYTSLMVVFTVVAYHYDFLACFLLYMISVIWLCCKGERQPIEKGKNN